MISFSKTWFLPYIFRSTKITENVWKKSSFRKTDHGLLCTPDLVYHFFEFISYTFQRESVKYINSGRISWLWNPIQTFEFPAILPRLPMMQLRAWTGLLQEHTMWSGHRLQTSDICSSSSLSSIFIKFWSSGMLKTSHWKQTETKIVKTTNLRHF